VDSKAHAASITVRDTGVGITPEILPQVFDVFRQAEQGLDRHRGGLGLGLSLVKGLVELHKGTVRAESEGPGKGALFTIRLPLYRGDIGEAQDIEASPIGEIERQKILLIEDNRDTAESARLLLSEEGHDVHIAYNGPDGLARARQIRPAVILCDIGLPGMDGYEIARAIRQDTTLAPVHVIALTGYGRDEDQRRAIEAGFDQHLTKPIDFSVLRQTLARRRRA
jgi:CheY-like chemotaxis protein